MRPVRRFLIVLLLPAVMLAGCTQASKTYKKAEQEAAQHNWDQAVLLYSKATSLKPNNMQYSIAH